jgi:hypothetical protein
LFIGIFLIGIGELINHPLETVVVRPNVYRPGGGIWEGHPHKNEFLGILFDIVGAILFVIALYKIIKLTKFYNSRNSINLLLYKYRIPRRIC